jgi:hypothetical protein
MNMNALNVGLSLNIFKASLLLRWQLAFILKDVNIPHQKRKFHVYSGRGQGLFSKVPVFTPPITVVRNTRILRKKIEMPGPPPVRRHPLRQIPPVLQLKVKPPHPPLPRRRNDLRYLSRSLPFLTVSLVLCGFAWWFQVHQANERLERAIEFEQAGKMAKALEQYEWTIQAYSPCSQAVDTAVHRLETIARDASARGDMNLAREAWQALLSGLTVIRHIYQPYGGTLVMANHELHTLEIRMQQSPAGLINGATTATTITGSNQRP